MRQGSGVRGLCALLLVSLTACQGVVAPPGNGPGNNGLPPGGVSPAGAEPQTTAVLTLRKSGGGSGRMVVQGLLDCGEACAAPLAKGKLVRIELLPAAGSHVGALPAACQQTLVDAAQNRADCLLVMNQELTVTVPFEANPVLRVERRGAGTLRAEPGAVDCTNGCDLNAPPGQRFVLTAEAGADAYVASWSGANCTGSRCEVVMGSAAALQVQFENRALLRVNKSGQAGGVVTVTDSAASGPPVIDCGDRCEALFNPLERRILIVRATPAAGAVLMGFAGPCTPRLNTPNANECEVLMSEARTLTARFEPAPTPPRLTVRVEKEGGANGSVQVGNRLCEEALCVYPLTTAPLQIEVSGNAHSYVSALTGQGCDPALERCTLMNIGQDNEVNVRFSPTQLTVSKRGAAGTLRSDSSRLNCGASCSSHLPKGQVALWAQMGAGACGVRATGATCSAVDPVSESALCTVDIQGANRADFEFTPCAWQRVESTPLGASTIQHLAAVQSDELWAASSTQLFHFKQGVWQPHLAGRFTRIEALYASGRNDVWAVGSERGVKPLIQHWTGSAFERIALPWPAGVQRVLSVHTLSGEAPLLFVGADGAGNAYLTAWQRDGTVQWPLGRAPLGFFSSVSGATQSQGADSYWLTGRESLQFTPAHPAAARYLPISAQQVLAAPGVNGGESVAWFLSGTQLTCSQEAAPYDLGQAMHRLWADREGRVWAVGDTGTLLQFAPGGATYCGAALTSHSAAVFEGHALHAFSGTGLNHLWTAGEAGSLFQYR